MSLTPQMQANAAQWRALALRLLPFADASSQSLPLGRLMRLSLFQVSVGIATALVVGTLNRVMIVELGVSAALVAVMVALPLVVAPFRALIGHKSDTHKSAFGVRRLPYLWFGTLMLFGGLSFMPFALLVLSGKGHAPAEIGLIFAALSFLLVGAGVQTTQTAGLALATDLAPEADRPRVVALMYVMLLVGMVAAGFVFAGLLADFSPMRLAQVVQGAAVLVFALNIAAMWRQEGRQTQSRREEDPSFGQTWRAFIAIPGAKRFLLAVALGSAAFNMQDVLLEPYGGQILGLPVSETTILTAFMALGGLAAFGLAAKALMGSLDPHRLATYGIALGLPAFALVVLAGPMQSGVLFCAGAVLIGFAAGLFSVSTLTAAMGLDPEGRAGLALGAWGAVQATVAGVAVAVGGVVRDVVSHLGAQGLLGPALADPVVGYMAVYHLELALLFAALIAIGPLARHAPAERSDASSKFGLAEFPT
jgi:MFS transporter, BCD family, chlorophyll transporter